MENTENYFEQEVEPNRYNGLPLPVKVFFLSCTVLGVGLGFFYIYGFYIKGLIVNEASYYYFLYAFFLNGVFLTIPARRKDIRVPWYDYVACILCFGIAFYFALNGWKIRDIGWTMPSPLNFSLALVFILLVLEAGRRSCSIWYLAVLIIVGVYPLIAEYLPGMLFGLQYNINHLVGLYAFGSEGMIGLVAQVLGKYILGFLVFAGILTASGAGEFFINLAQCLMGTSRGGAAKTAVIASSFMGMLSGSALANVATTGVFTIPAMKRTGYEPHYAGAIEACASTGGAIAPPVMGALAFLACALTGQPYSVIMIAAIIPTILYYYALFMQVDFYAARLKLTGLPKEQIPSFRKCMKRGWPYIAVLIFLIWGLVFMRWEMLTPFYASVLMIILSFCSKETMITPSRLIHVISTVGKLLSQITALVLPAGIIVASLIITGASGSFVSMIISLAGQNIFFILSLGFIACYLLGMAGMVAAPYIFLALTMIPAIMQISDLNLLSLHFFLIWFGPMAGITPPVAVVAFLAASIAKAPPMKTAFTACRLAIVLYFIPFFFVYNSALILQGPLWESAYLLVLCLIGITYIAAGLEGYLFKFGNLGILTRCLFLIAGLLIAFPYWKTQIIGTVIVCLTMAIILIMRKRSNKGAKFVSIK